MLKFRFDLKTSRPKRRVWAAMCTGTADGSIEQYASGARHAIIVMVQAGEGAVEESVCRLLSEYGWSSAEITRTKLLDDPFESEDPDMLRCYKGAVEKEGGIIVYSDPILTEHGEP